MILWLRGQVPSGKNQVRIDPRSGRHYPNKNFVRWREDALRQVMGQRPLPWRPFKVPCVAAVVYVPGDLIRRDVPGIQDALCHLLERSGIVENDVLLKDWVFITRPLDRANPRLLLSITPLDAAREL